MDVNNKQTPLIEIYRDRLISAYNNSTDSEITAKDLTLYPHGGNFVEINKDMRNLLKPEKETPLSFHTYQNLVNQTNTQLTSAIRKTIDDYFKIAQEKKRSSSNDINNTLLIGAKLINEVFKNKIELLSKTMRFVDFYSSRIDGGNQWLGITKDLDFNRPVLKKLEKEILIAIKSKRISKVCAAVVGTHGIGKSTVLRRLALICIKYESIFQTFWVEDLEKFNSYFSRYISNNNQPFLLIIDDWEKVTSGDRKSINTLFRNLTGYTNVAIVIADTCIKSEWSDYLYGRNIFGLELSENKNILSHILSKMENYLEIDHRASTQTNVAQWLEIIKLMMDNKSLDTSPIFIILFIVIRKVEERGDILEVDTQDLWAQFNSVVQNDYQRIYYSFPGLAKTLYYWACVSSRCNEFRPLLTWRALLTLSDYYNNNDLPSKELLAFNNQKDICKTLAYYFSFKKIEGFSYEHKYFIDFQHICIAEAMSIAPNINWYFEDKLMLEIAGLFIDFGMKDVAEQFLIVHARNVLLEEFKWSYKKFDTEAYLREKEEYMNRKEVRAVYTKLQPPFKGLKFQRYMEELITNLLNNELAGFEQDQLIRFAAELYDEKDGCRTANYIASLLIEKGCKSDLLKELYVASNSKDALKKFYLKNFMEVDFI
ncbi:hypothetical protein J3L18_22350 [Mucilaginibacter gossypii]|uniref:P-loop NTPase n=1 Tax=Mucilaginibacter gossypii TaxID=551996 RepID=UPI000DCD978F|nr:MULTISPECIES: hypothetical protein [Mucilaginibacter]QTE35868.1 hypothetical protein J3L18_22350 [Mucilaginibacter gossypii]RAV54674.1 hypothetical protein DIU36_20035 [Mucilaginibacter rubeus]